jgi:hypothetical protein
MPFSITEKDGLIWCDLYDVVTVKDMQELAVGLWEAEKNRAVIPPRITDLSAVSGLEINFNSVLRLAEDRKTRTFPNTFKSAIVAPKDHLLGYARMFQTLNDHPQIIIRIFRDLPAAETWLREE